MNQVKRRRVNWFKILVQEDNPFINEQFFSLSKKLKRGKRMSFNRCAYYALKSYYSTTTIDELCSKLGI